MKLIITRHGKTIENQNEICQGQTGGNLSEEGIEQIRKLGKRLRNEVIHVIYSSDLKRTVDTTREILKYQQEVEVLYDKRLRERYLGKLQGCKFPDNWDWNNLPKYVETDEDMYIRAKEIINEIYQKNKNKTVLIVAHGGLNLALFSVIFNKGSASFSEFNESKNTSVSIFEMKTNGVTITHLLNCVKHLDSENK